MARAVKIGCGISFRLRDNKAITPTPITCFVEFDGKPVVKIPTGTKILPSKWNPEKERPIGGMKGLESMEAGAITEKLSAVRTTVENNYREHVNRFKTYPDKEIFKEQVMQSISGEVTAPKVEDRPNLSLLNFFERQIRLSREGKRLIIKGPRKGKPYRENTIKSYEGTLALLRDYMGDRKLKALDFDDITMEFYHDLRSYMFEDVSFSLNYFGKVIKHIKLFMKEAEEEKLHGSTTYRSKVELQLKSGDFFTLLIFLFSLAFLPFGLVFYVQ